MTVLARCPVCGGNGLRPEGFYTTTTGVWGSTGTSTEPCRSCGGRGVIEPQLERAVDVLVRIATRDYDPLQHESPGSLAREALAAMGVDPSTTRGQ